MSGNGKIVCVTGASGYVASWLVKLLLQYGYTVRATVRDPSDPKKTEHLHALEGAKERLHLFKADLVKEGSFDTVIEGCDCVFHTASPVIADVKDLQAELIDPAVNGTLNVLRSCVKSFSVKRVVLTSSMATVSSNDRKLAPDLMVDETWFASSDFYKEKKQWYHLSKTLAEEEAWKFTKEHGIDMVVIIPGLVVGPLLQPTLNASFSGLLSLINGTTKTLPDAIIRGIDVKDVAKAHILAYEVPSASGRYCLVERVIHYKEAVEIIQKLYPSLPLPGQCESDTSFEPTHGVSKEKARSLGIDFIPLDQSFKEAIESLKEKGFFTL